MLLSQAALLHFTQIQFFVMIKLKLNTQKSKVLFSVAP